MCTQQGWPFVKGNFDDALCPYEWWHIPWFQALRYVLWIFLFVLSVVLFFFTTCIFLPRLNGRRDTTGLCGTSALLFSRRAYKHTRVHTTW